MIFFLLQACAPISEDISWSGNVYALYQSQLESITEGSLILSDRNGNQLLDATSPYEDSPSYRSFALTPDLFNKEILVTCTLPMAYPTIWRGQAPQSNAIWLNGALYGYGTTWADNFFLSLGLDAQPLSEGNIVHMIGRPSIPEDWMDTQLSLTDPSGNSYEVLRYRYDDAGFLLAIPPQQETERIDMFVALNLPPGALYLEITAPQQTIELDYFAPGGAIISAAHILYSSSQP